MEQLLHNEAVLQPLWLCDGSSNAATVRSGGLVAGFFLLFASMNAAAMAPIPRTSTSASVTHISAPSNAPRTSAATVQPFVESSSTDGGDNSAGVELEPAAFAFVLAPLPAEREVDAPRLRPESRWDAPCEAMFEALAEEAPDRLVAFLNRTDVNGAHIASAAEVAGKRLPADAVTEPLLHVLAHHARPMAREGAILGLYFHLADPRVHAAVKEAATSDSVEEVRGAALDVLEIFAESDAR